MRALEHGVAGRRLLVVEEDRHNIDALRDAFGGLGYECEVALDLETAQTILGERRMALAVVNAQVPGVTDETLITELKRIAPDIRIVLYNGTSKKTRQRRLRRLGADSYLSTGDDMSTVVRSVQRVLG